MRTTLDLPDDLFRQAKIHAAVKGISLKELFTDALRLALKSQAISFPVHAVAPDTNLDEKSL